MRRERKRRNVIIFSLIGILLLMAAGYAAFSTQLNISGKSDITSKWEIKIISVSNGTATGSAENETAPTFTDLTANMSANLYAKGDAMDYDVVISNTGDFDASLDDVLTDVKTSNDAVKITFSGYTKGQILYKNTTQTVHVKIEYDSNYSGTGSGSGEVEVTFNYTQASGGNVTPEDKFLVTYDCTENGGAACTTNNEYLSDGATVSLTPLGSKSGWTFIGWNTNKNATTALTTAPTINNADVTLYAIFKKEVTLTYQKGDNVSSIGKTSDTCTIYNANTYCTVTLPSITPNGGYKASGWYDGTTKAGNASASYNATDTKTLTAKATEDSYTLTYNYNNATSGNTSTSKSVTYNGTYGTLPSPSRAYTVTYNYNGATGGNSVSNATANYTFGGWYKESTFTNQVTSSTKYTTAGNSVIYAKWTSAQITLPSPTKTNYVFDGWYSESSLTNKIGDAGTSYTPTASSTIYAKWVEDNVSVTLSTTATTNSVTAVANATADSGISKYEFSKDGGSTWINNGTNNTYTFTGLTPGSGAITQTNPTCPSPLIFLEVPANMQNVTNSYFGQETSYLCCTSTTLNAQTIRQCSLATAANACPSSEYTLEDGMCVKQGDDYTISTRVTANSGKTATDSKSGNLGSLTKPTFSETTTGIRTVNITYPEGCGNTLTCTYQKKDASGNNVGSAVTVNSTTADVQFTTSGSVVATVSDGTNTASDSYTVSIGSPVLATGPNFQTKMNSYKSSVTSIEVVDSINVPNGATAIDVSAANDGSVIAWIVNNKLYIGGNGGVIANADSSSLFKYFTRATSIAVSNLDVSNVINASHMFGACFNLTSLNLSGWDTSNMTDMSYMFSGEEEDYMAITSITFGSDWDTSNVTNMSNMFSYCESLAALDVSNFDTSSVTDMSAMFEECGSLTSLDVSGFDTSSVTNMSDMFNYCSVGSLDVSNWDTSSVMNMGHMFNGCRNLTSLDLSSFDTSNVTNMSYMFSSMANLTTIYASDNFVTTKVTSTNSSTDMFKSTTKLVGGNGTAVATKQVYDKTYAKIDKSGQEGYFTSNVSLPILTTGSDFQTKMASYKSTVTSIEVVDSINIPSGVTGVDVSAANDGSVMAWIDNNKLYIGGNGGVTANVDSSNLFQGFYSATTIDVSKLDTSDVTNMSYMFSTTVHNGQMARYGALTTIIGLDSFDTNNVTDMSYMFYEDKNLASLDVTGFDTSSVTNMGSMFGYCSGLTSLDVTGFDTSSVTNMGSMFANCSGLTSLDVTGFDTSSVTNMGSMFSGCSGLTSLDVTGFDTSSVTDMGSMFGSCRGLTSIDVTSFDTSSVTNMGLMFANCSGLTSLDVTGFDTGSVTNMRSMFVGCTNLTSLDVTGFDTSSVTIMNSMFRNCSGLTSLDVTGFDTSNVTDMGSMFAGCSGLTSLDVSGFDTTSVTNMGSMFSGCSGLTNLNLSNFDTTSVTNMASMFRNMTNLTTIYVSEDFVTTGVTSSSTMFEGSTNLVGGNGTAVATKQVYDKTYAKIDKSGQEGYFTDATIPVISSLATSNIKTKSIRATATATAAGNSSNIAKYEFKKSTDSTWVDNGTSNIYDFTGLTENTSYTLMVRVTSKGGGTATSSVTARTSTFNAPSLASATGDDYAKTVRITYPSGCGSSLTCTYRITKNNVNQGSATTVSSTSATVNLSGGGTWRIIATASDGQTTKNYTYTVTLISQPILADGTTFNSEITSNYTVSNITSVEIVDVDLTTGGYSDIYDYIDGEYPNAVGSEVDVSAAQDEGVLAWFTNNTLYIGGVGGVIANVESGILFRGFTNVTSMNLTNFDTSNVENMNSMFAGCTSLTTLDLSNFNTSNVTNMGSMFFGCLSLASLDLSSFDTSNVLYMTAMFAINNQVSDCLITLDLSSFDTSNVQDMSTMFWNRRSLETIYVSSDFVTTSVTGGVEMFTNCNSLVGGNGSAYSNYLVNDYTFAHIDEGTSNPGYFTEGNSIPSWVSSRSGLEPDPVTPGRYIYTGADPDNYMLVILPHSSEGIVPLDVRILAIEPDGTITAMVTDANMTDIWDANGGNNWSSATLRSNLQSANFEYVSYPHTMNYMYNAGSIYSGTIYDLNSMISYEEDGAVFDYVGLMTVSDFIKASGNLSTCGNINLYQTNNATCVANNWIANEMNNNGVSVLWTTNGILDVNAVWGVSSSGFNNFPSTSTQNYFPVIHFSADLPIGEGTGASDNPYITTKYYMYSNNTNEMTIGTSDYSAVSSFVDPFSTNVYLRHKFDVDNSDTLVESAACFTYGGVPYCLIGGDGGAAYSKNVATLQEAFGSNYSNYCTDNGSYIDCRNVPNFSAIVTDNSGITSAIDSNFGCDVFEDGVSLCG